MPEIPEFLRGRSLVIIDGAYIGDEASAGELFQPLRDLGPEMDTFAMIPPVGLSRIHMDPEGATPALGGAALMLAELPDEAIDAFLAATGPGSNSALLMAEIRHIGGALARKPVRAGALGRFNGEYMTFAAGIPVTPEIAAAIHVGLATLTDALTPWDSGSAYLNFTEDKVDPAKFYPASNYERLRRVKAEVDPTGLFRGNHAISAA